ncbi:MAG: GHKL domain-containing protein, partial [Bdellovibrionales bacterium]|nr:GHKL domain-containing protein [Bdellovibrionales bacterium]
EPIETKRLTKSGEMIDISLGLSPILDGRGNLLGVASISRDVSKRIAVEEQLARYREHLEKLVEERTAELNRSQEQLRRSERMASIGALAAGIAHEINNPVGAMLLAAQNAQERSRTLTEVEEARQLLERVAEKVITNAKRCGQIVKGVLQFARQEVTEKWPNDVNTVVRGSLQLVGESVRKRGTIIETDLADGLPTATLNPIEIEQVLINLIDNAINASGEGQRIGVRTRLVAEMIELSVADEGAGMTAEEQQRIFDPFFTTRIQKGGTGLGLSIVHGIVEGHGGSITVESHLHQGTVFRILLPLAGDGGGLSPAEKLNGAGEE